MANEEINYGDLLALVGKIEIKKINENFSLANFITEWCYCISQNPDNLELQEFSVVSDKNKNLYNNYKSISICNSNDKCYQRYNSGKDNFFTIYLRNNLEDNSHDNSGNYPYKVKDPQDNESLVNLSISAKSTDNDVKEAVKSIGCLSRIKEINDEVTVIKKIQAYRNYDDDFIKNVLICIAQNFITVFAGQPGTGKTSLCDIISGVLGLYNPDPKLNLYRYRSVSVERGWNSKSELIGYYNALSNKFENSGNGIYDALLTLNAECNNVNIDPYPFFILLDEANLSPVEHYWSAFMKLADESELHKDYRGEIAIGGGEKLRVPYQLRFLATVNNDLTTEPLSPRLLDRTSVIKLPETANQPNPNVGYAPYYITWNRFKYLFSPVNDTEISNNIGIAGNLVSEIMNIIYGMFKAANISISKRVKNRIARYINSACFLGMPPEKAINYAVAQNLLPKINGFYEDFKIRGEDNTNSKHLFTELEKLLGEIEDAIGKKQSISLNGYKVYLEENAAEQNATEEENGAKQNATEEAFEAFKKAEANNDYISYLSL